jgi:hypothetical protein
LPKCEGFSGLIKFLDLFFKGEFAKFDAAAVHWDRERSLSLDARADPVSPRPG